MQRFYIHIFFVDNTIPMPNGLSLVFGCILAYITDNDLVPEDGSKTYSKAGSGTVMLCNVFDLLKVRMSGTLSAFWPSDSRSIVEEYTTPPSVIPGVPQGLIMCPQERTPLTVIQLIAVSCASQIHVIDLLWAFGIFFPQVDRLRQCQHGHRQRVVREPLQGLLCRSSSQPRPQLRSMNV